MPFAAVPVSIALAQARAGVLPYYSPHYFVPHLPAADHPEPFGPGGAAGFGQLAGQAVLADRPPVQWLVQHLAWDSAYFGAPTHRLVTGLFGPETGAAALREAAAALRRYFAAQGPGYVFSLVPAQDSALLQALTGGGWQLIETRLHYYHDAVASHAHPRYPVRLAAPAEAPTLGRVAAAARNPYDRFHADPWFGPARADAFLARYAEASVQGYADAVLVPDAPGLPLDAFVALRDGHAGPPGPATACSRVLLAAVGPANRGWHLRLVSEALHRARERGYPTALMTTQATNGAVVRAAAKLGFQLGGTSHVLACGVPLPH